MLRGIQVTLHGDDEIQFSVRDDDEYRLSAHCPGNCLTSDNWVFLTCVRAADPASSTHDTLSIYVNGAVLARKNVPKYSVSNHNNLRFGSHPVFEYGLNIDGYLDDIRVFQYALDDRDVAALVQDTWRLHCFEVVNPPNSMIGSCRADALLASLDTCNFACDFGYKQHGGWPFCNYGFDLGNVTCTPTDVGINCTDVVADNYNVTASDTSPTDISLDDGSCNYTCPTIAAHYGVTPTRCIIFAHNPWVWHGVLAVIGTAESVILQGGPAGFAGWDRGVEWSRTEWMGTIEVRAGQLVARRVILQGRTTNAGALSVEGGEATLVGCLFLSNTAEVTWTRDGLTGGSGAAITAAAGARLVLENCLFEGNRGALTGGAIFLTKQADCYMANCTFRRNDAGIRGGAIGVVNGSTLRIESSTFNGNAIFVQLTHGRRMEETEAYIAAEEYRFSAIGVGGALYSDDSRLTVERCVIENNEASIAGGGIWVSHGAANISYTEVASNLLPVTISQNVSILPNGTTWSAGDLWPPPALDNADLCRHLL